MKQPDRIQVTPSAPCDWYGTWEEGERFSAQQRHRLRELCIDPATAEALTVRRRATMAEMWWPAGQAAPLFEMPCPIIRRLADGRIKVVAPAGVNRIVQGDGWITRQQSRANAGRGRRGA